MKTTLKVLGFSLAVVALSFPVYAGLEVGMAPAAKTLIDFQRDFTGTKPVIAWHKYQDYLQMKNVPQPTLGVSRMRVSPEEMTANDYAAGTKGIAGLLKFWEAKRELARPQTAKIHGAVVRDAASGTKPVVGFLKR